MRNAAHVLHYAFGTNSYNVLGFSSKVEFTLRLVGLIGRRLDFGNQSFYDLYFGEGAMFW